MDTLSFEPPEGLLQRILTRMRIEERRLRLAKRNLVVFGVIAVGSLTALIPAYRGLSADIASSGLGDFLWLAATDSFVIAALWREFAFSILESLPIISMGASLATFLASIASLRMIMASFEKITNYRLASN